VGKTRLRYYVLTLIDCREVNRPDAAWRAYLQRPDAISARPVGLHGLFRMTPQRMVAFHQAYRFGPDWQLLVEDARRWLHERGVKEL